MDCNRSLFCFVSGRRDWVVAATANIADYFLRDVMSDGLPLGARCLLQILVLSILWLSRIRSHEWYGDGALGDACVDYADAGLDFCAILLPSQRLHHA